MNLLQLTRQLVNRDRRVAPGHRKFWSRNLLVLSDVHGDRLELDTSYQPDFVLLLGDIPHHVIQDVDAMFSCPKFGVLGNHDGLDYFDGTSVLNLHGNVVEVDGITFAGFGGSPRYNEWKDDVQFTEEEARSFLDQLGYVDVLLAHSNAKGIGTVWEERVIENPLDDFMYRPRRTGMGTAHDGYQALTDYINRAQPAYVLHGHIHKEWEQRAGDTVVHAVHKLKRVVI